MAPLRPRVAFIYDRSNTELLALPLKRVCKEYGVTNTIGNLGGIALDSNVEDDRCRSATRTRFEPVQAGRARFLQTLSSPPASKVVTVSCAPFSAVPQPFRQ